MVQICAVPPPPQQHHLESHVMWTHAEVRRGPHHYSRLHAETKRGQRAVGAGEVVPCQEPVFRHFKMPMPSNSELVEVV
uniref:Uncharacterized protein n=1 Tax=Echinococcus granulosus TaxID=6210 RepID=A0A068WC65_ECHGR|nr:hypothetical protein EgrG_002017800 [Echinococcus granulosus]